MNRKEKTKLFYNQIASQTFHEWFNNPTLMPTLKSFINNLPQKPLILDLGCGTGGETKRLTGLGANVIGIDFSEESLKFAKENVPEAQFILMDILDMDFSDSYFDGVVEAGVLFHFSEVEQEQIIKKIYSILKSKGRFLSYYPKGTFEGMEEINIAGKNFQRYSRFMEKNKWINQVVKNGFHEYIEKEFNLDPFVCVEFLK